MTQLEVVKVDDKTFELKLNGHVLGTSKSDSDARFHMHVLEKLFEETYNRGYADGDFSREIYPV